MSHVDLSQYHHRHRHKWGVAGNDPAYPKSTYYADQEREAQERKPIAGADTWGDGTSCET